MIYSSITVGFEGKSSRLEADFLPEIMLDPNSEYCCALVDIIITNCVEMSKLTDQNVLRVECDIKTSSYINGPRSRSFHQFAPSTSRVNSGTLVEIPQNLIYFPVKIKNLRSIQISLVNREGQLVDLKGDLNYRIHIKKITSTK